MECFTENKGSLFYLRLSPGEPFLEGIIEACTKNGIKYGSIVSCIGSLSRTAYTFVKDQADSITKIAYRDTIITDKPNELICAQGTVGQSAEGGYDIHMHALMCDTDGTLFAGHMLPGSVICATMEICIAATTAGELVREYDEQLHFPLFHFKKKAS